MSSSRMGESKENQTPIRVAEEPTMSYTTTAPFRTLCRLVLCCFTLATFHPASLRVPWTLHFAPWTLDFGPTPAYGQAADLAPTPDADSTDPFIVQKAQELGNDPVQITLVPGLSWVRSAWQALPACGRSCRGRAAQVCSSDFSRFPEGGRGWRISS
jgi:hypothetical protein